VDNFLELDMHTAAFMYYIERIANRNGVLYYNNKKRIKSFKDLRQYINLSSGVWDRNIIPNIKKYNIISKLKDAEGWKILVNPIFNSKGIISKELFDLFEKEIEKDYSYYKYIQLKSKFYKIEDPIIASNYPEMCNNISGIYRLYKNNKIIYIGKSVDIKKRLYTHNKEKDMDEFDFTILDNESDKNIYELYYIDKYKPLYNKDCLEESISSIKLEELVFSNKIKIGEW